MKEGEEISKEHACITHGHRQQCGDEWPEGEQAWGPGGDRQRERTLRTSVIV